MPRSYLYESQAFVRDPDGYYIEFCNCESLDHYLEKVQQDNSMQLWSAEKTRTLEKYSKVLNCDWIFDSNKSKMCRSQVFKRIADESRLKVARYRTRSRSRSKSEDRRRLSRTVSDVY